LILIEDRGQIGIITAPTSKIKIWLGAAEMIGYSFATAG